MRRMLAVSFLLLAMVVALPATSSASSRPGHGIWSHLTKPAVRVQVNLPFLPGTWVEYLTVKDIHKPSKSYWDNVGSGWSVDGWSRSFNFRIHSEGAVIDTIYYVFDGIRTNVGIRKPRRPVKMSWSVPNMGNNASMTMEVVVYMHVEGGPVRRWPSENDPASFTLMHYNVRELRESVPR